MTDSRQGLDGSRIAARRALPEVAARPQARSLQLSIEMQALRSQTVLVGRVRREFAELPGLNLTLPQARLLFSLPARLCVDVLEALCADGTLMRSPDGRYCRRHVA